jgi:hypothetical protein
MQSSQASGGYHAELELAVIMPVIVAPFRVGSPSSARLGGLSLLSVPAPRSWNDVQAFECFSNPSAVPRPGIAKI